MKFILDEPEDKEPKIKLYLEDGEDRILLIGIDGWGNTECIMRFKNGEFFRHQNIDLEGVKTDSIGQINEDK